jgi:hypothetical protein
MYAYEQAVFIYNVIKGNMVYFDDCFIVFSFRNPFSVGFFFSNLLKIKKWLLLQSGF